MKHIYSAFTIFALVSCNEAVVSNGQVKTKNLEAAKSDPSAVATTALEEAEGGSTVRTNEVLMPQDGPGETPPTPEVSPVDVTNLETGLPVSSITELPSAVYKVEISNDTTISGAGSNISGAELNGCRSYFNNLGRVVPYSNGGSITLGANDILAIKVTGNSQEVRINLAPLDPDSSIFRLKGVCFFLAGNQAKGVVNLENTILEKLYTRAVGNDAITTISVNSNATLGDYTLVSNSSGARLIIEGSGFYTCLTSDPGIECLH